MQRLASLCLTTPHLPKQRVQRTQAHLVEILPSTGLRSGSGWPRRAGRAEAGVPGERDPPGASGSAGSAGGRTGSPVVPGRGGSFRGGTAGSGVKSSAAHITSGRGVVSHPRNMSPTKKRCFCVCIRIISRDRRGKQPKKMTYHGVQADGKKTTFQALHPRRRKFAKNIHAVNCFLISPQKRGHKDECNRREKSEVSQPRFLPRMCLGAKILSAEVKLLAPSRGSPNQCLRPPCSREDGRLSWRLLGVARRRSAPRCRCRCRFCLCWSSWPPGLSWRYRCFGRR